MGHEICSKLSSGGDGRHGLLLVDWGTGIAGKCVPWDCGRYGDRRVLLRVLRGGVEGVHGPQRNFIGARICQEMLEDPGIGGALGLGQTVSI